MARKDWRGDAQSIAQVVTLTIGGTVGAGDTVSAIINLKTITFTCVGTETLDEVAAGLYELLAASQIAEFVRISFYNDSTAVITCTARDAGRPFVMTTDDTGTVTITPATVTAATGPNHLDDANNWGGVLPTTNDDLYFPPDIINGPLYGLDVFDSETFSSITFLGGFGGLPEMNSDGYVEYLGKTIEIGDVTNTIAIGDGVNGVSFLRLKVSGSGSCSVKVDNGQALTANVGEPGVYLSTGGSISLVLNIVSGSAGLAFFPGETITISALKVGTEGAPGSIGASDEVSAANIGSGATVTATTLYAGDVRTAASTALTIEGGDYVQTAGNIGAVTGRGGRLIFNSNGTMGAIALTGPDCRLDMTGDTRAVGSITSLSCLGGAHFWDDHKRLGNVAVVLDEYSSPLCRWGSLATLTRS